MKPNQTSSSARLRLAFCALVAFLAVFQFSENTADPDLWGHIIFGRQILHSGAIPKREIYSWTAQGQPWINHEWLAELALAGAHQAGGGSGVLLLKMAIGLLTFALCLRMGGADLLWPDRYAAWAVGALAVVEISYGFAARPQIFTALFLVFELMLLRRIHNGARLWALALPVLFVFWINAHGGALVGFALLGLTAVATSAQALRRVTSRQTILTLWLAVVVCAAALFCNPWQGGLLRWLVGSMLWMRPEIQEWNPTPLGWDHAALFVLIALGIFAWGFSWRPKTWWEPAACAFFALLGLRAARNAPLYAIVALALTPPHLVNAPVRFRGSFAGLAEAASDPVKQKFTALLCCLGAAGAGIATFTLHKEHPLTMEVPRGQYPAGAMDFMRKNEMWGRLLVFFDWGEEVIFELPQCPPSIDGRLDTCYSRELIDAHWQFYNGEPYDQKVLHSDEADLALLPRNLAGTFELAKHPGWKVVYLDGLAAILARDPARFPALGQFNLPVTGPAVATQGRAAFPDQSPRWKAE
jgi:hypothetical protein